MFYTGCSRNRGRAGKILISRTKVGGKYRIKPFCSRLCFKKKMDMKIHEVLNLNMANSGLGERSRVGIYSTCENKRKIRN